LVFMTSSQYEECSGRMLAPNDAFCVATELTAKPELAK